MSNSVSDQYLREVAIDSTREIRKAARPVGVGCIVAVVFSACLFLFLSIVGVAYWLAASGRLAEMIPLAERDQATFEIRLDGAPAEEIDLLMSGGLQQQLGSIRGVDFVESRAYAGRGTLTARSGIGGEIDEAGLQSLVDNIREYSSSLPVPAEWSIPASSSDALPAVVIVFERASDEDDSVNQHSVNHLSQIQLLASFANELKQIPDVTRAASHANTLDVIVELDPEQLAAHKIPVLAVENAIQQSVTESSLAQNIIDDIGNLKVGGLEDGNFAAIRELATIRLSTGIGGIAGGPTTDIVTVELSGPSSADQQEQIEHRAKLFADNSPHIKSVRVVWLDRDFDTEQPPAVFFRMKCLDRNDLPNAIGAFSQSLRNHDPNLRMISVPQVESMESELLVIVFDSTGSPLDKHEIWRQQQTTHAIVGTRMTPVDARMDSSGIQIRRPVEFALVGADQSEPVTRWARDALEEIRQDSRVDHILISNPVESEARLNCEIDDSKADELGVDRLLLAGYIRNATSVDEPVIEMKIGEHCFLKVWCPSLQVDFGDLTVPAGTGTVPLRDLATIQIGHEMRSAYRIDERFAAKIAIFPDNNTERLAIATDVVDILKNVGGNYFDGDVEVILINP